MKNILDIIYDYSIKQKLLDEDTIIEIIKKAIKQSNIDTVNKFFIDYSSFKPLINNTLGSYCNGEINIYINRIMSNIKKNYRYNDCDNILSYYLKINLYILYIIFHELEHAIEEMKVYNKDEDIETKLLTVEREYLTQIELSKYYDGYKSSLKSDFNYKKELKRYKKNSLISFYERMATIHAYDKILQVISPIKKEIESLYSLQEGYFISSKIEPYLDSKDAPTIRFFEGINKMDKINNINFSTLGFEERLDYGLSLLDEEYVSVKKLIRR